MMFQLVAFKLDCQVNSNDRDQCCWLVRPVSLQVLGDIGTA